MAFNRSQAIHRILSVEFEGKGAGTAGIWNDCGDAPPAAYIDWWLPKRRAELEAMTNADLQAELAGCGWRDRIRESVIVERMEASINGEQRNQSIAAGIKSGKVRQRKASDRHGNIIARGRQLLAERPRLRADRAYNQLGLNGVYKFGYFERRLWPKILGRHEPG